MGIKMINYPSCQSCLFACFALLRACLLACFLCFGACLHVFLLACLRARPFASLLACLQAEWKNYRISSKQQYNCGTWPRFMLPVAETRFGREPHVVEQLLLLYPAGRCLLPHLDPDRRQYSFASFVVAEDASRETKLGASKGITCPQSALWKSRRAILHHGAMENMFNFNCACHPVNSMESTEQYRQHTWF